MLVLGSSDCILPVVLRSGQALTAIPQSAVVTRGQENPMQISAFMASGPTTMMVATLPTATIEARFFLPRSVSGSRVKRVRYSPSFLADMKCRRHPACFSCLQARLVLGAMKKEALHRTSPSTCWYMHGKGCRPFASHG